MTETWLPTTALPKRVLTWYPMKTTL